MGVQWVKEALEGTLDEKVLDALSSHEIFKLSKYGGNTILLKSCEN